MYRVMCRAKIHNATVTETKLEYVGSISIDESLLREADILPGEKVEAYNISNGARFSTYTIAGEENSGKICVNGAAARLAQKGDKLIVVSYAVVSDEEAREFKQKVVFVGEDNRIVEKMEN